MYISEKPHEVGEVDSNTHFVVPKLTCDEHNKTPKVSSNRPTRRLSTHIYVYIHQGEWTSLKVNTGPQTSTSCYFFLKCIDIRESLALGVESRQSAKARALP